MPRLKGRFVCVWNYLIFFVGEYPSVWPEIFPNFSGNSYIEFEEETLLGEFFRNFVRTKVILYKNFWNSALFSAILFSVCIALKFFLHKYFHMLFAPRQGDMSIKKSQKNDRGRKARTFCFRKTILCTLGLGLTTPYSLGILV